MPETMGQIIKKLRKEHNFTQEELAEQLGVTFQAVSKWENGFGMPDISQVIPLATVFGVSTDVLFGICDKNNSEEVQEIIKSAVSLITEPATTKSVRCCYNALTDGLKKYPNNTTLSLQCLETGIALSYPENDIFDSENSKSIYKQCVHYADLIIKYSENTTDILRAHMIMVMLHSAYGNMEAARKHANAFPGRADMTIHKMNAYISNFKKDYRTKCLHCQYDFMYHLEALLDSIVEIGYCYYYLGEHTDAQYTLTDAIELINLLGKNESIKPSLHWRENVNIYALLAEVYLKQGKINEAIQTLNNMVDYDLAGLYKYKSSIKIKTPLLRDTDNNYYAIYDNIRQKLLIVLNNPAFNEIKENDDFLKLLGKVNEC